MTTIYTEPPAAPPKLTPCPDWCTLPAGHGWDSYDPETGLWWCGHSGPNLGEAIYVGAQEKSDGTLVYDYLFGNNDDLPLDELRKVADCTLMALAWLQEHRSSAIRAEDGSLEFGSGAAYLDDDNSVVVVLGAEAARTADPVELRTAAADMIAAAEWLEAHR